MIDKIVGWDRELFLFLNSKHTDWLDPIMLFLSSYINWILVCAIMMAIIYWKAQSWKKVASLSLLLSTGVSALLTNLIKLVIERPRPIHNTAWEGQIHAIEEFSKSFSFFSSHSATTFAMALFFFMFFRNNKIYGIAAILWATLVAYSRVYVAKHYPFDVFVGILFGSLIGILGYKLYEMYIRKQETLEP